MFTPSSSADYETAFEYMKKLCVFLETSEISTEDGETYTADTIAAYDYKEGIRAALEEIYNNLKKSKSGYFEVFGLYRPAALNEKIIKNILKGGDAAAKFSIFITDLQYAQPILPDKKLYKKMAAQRLASIRLRNPFLRLFLIRRVLNMKIQPRQKTPV